MNDEDYDIMVMGIVVTILFICFVILMVNLHFIYQRSP